MIRKVAQGYIALKWMGFDLGFWTHFTVVTMVMAGGDPLLRRDDLEELKSRKKSLAISPGSFTSSTAAYWVPILC